MYELECQVTELLAQIKELSDSKEKLMIANRNARTLEEENTNLIVKLKSLENGKIDPSVFPTGTEAAKLIQENNELRASLRELNTSISKNRDTIKSKENELERQLRNTVADRDRMSKERDRQTKELDNVRRQCVDLQRTLDEERDTAKAASEIWEQERERYNQKIDDLLAAAKRTEGTSPVKDARPSERGNDLQEILLKEEVEQLSKKVKAAEERLWNKEKEWLRIESQLKAEVANARAASADESSEREVYRSLQDQIAALKREILQLRSERRTSRPAPFMPSESELSALNNDNASVAGSSVRGAGGPGGRAGGPGGYGGGNYFADMSPAQIAALTTDNSALRDQIDDLRTQLLETRLSAEEKSVRIKELEVLLATANAKRNDGPAGSSSNRGGPGRGGDYLDDNVSEKSYLNRGRNPEREMADLRKKVRDLQNELNNERAANEQKNTINEARLKECKGQIEELLQENEKLHNGGGFGPGVDDIFPDHFMSVIRLSKDKRDSVEDVMRLLESSWYNEAEALRQARNAKMQGAAMANHDAMKDEELRRLQGIIDDLRNRLNAAERERDANEELRERIRDLEDENAALKKRMRDEGKLQDKDKEDLNRELANLRDKIRDLEGKNRDAGDLQRQIKDLRDENNRLRRQMARSPRRDWSASGRTPERALSQLSVRSSDERKRSAVPEGAHLAVTVVELCDVLRNGRPITDPGYIIIKLKSIKEKYKTSVKELSSVIRFDESFEFYLAQPDEDVITLHVFYKPKDNNREYHIGDACFSMATLYRGVPRQRIAPVAQNPRTREARRAAQVEVILQTDDFGKMVRPTEAEVEDETLRFNEMVHQYESSAPEKLHAVDVYMASQELM